MIQLEAVEKVYRTDRIETVALTNINLNVRAGEFISIMGPSGSGKSTLLNVIGLLDVPTGGKVALNQKAITAYTDKFLAQVRNEELGFIFQTFHLINDLSVVDNVEIPLLYRKGVTNAERRKLALAEFEEKLIKRMQAIAKDWSFDVKTIEQMRTENHTSYSFQAISPRRPTRSKIGLTQKVRQTSVCRAIPGTSHWLKPTTN